MSAARADLKAGTRAGPEPGDIGDGIRLVPVGELDIATAPMFLGALAAALDRRPDSVEIDLRWLTFIDARSIGAIASASVRIDTWNGTLAASRAEGEVRRMFELCGLTYLLVAPSPDHGAPRPGTAHDPPPRIAVLAGMHERAL